MKFSGKLTQWNADRHFGFIAAEPSDEAIFVHGSALPRDVVPHVGMVLRFEVARDERGRKRASGVEVVGRRTPSRAARSRRGGGRRAWIIVPVMAAALCALGLRAWHRMTPAVMPLAANSDVAPAPGQRPAVPSASFRCDARQYCSQMTSCAEATWMLKNCPGMKVDGNHDGVPCEQQWCR